MLRWQCGNQIATPIYIEQFGLFKTYEDAVNSLPAKKIATVAEIEQVDNKVEKLQNTTMSFGNTFVAKDIAYGEGKFVAITDDNKIMYSYNGIVWNELYVSDTELSHIAYGNGKFIIIETSKIISVDSNNMAISFNDKNFNITNLTFASSGFFLAIAEGSAAAGVSGGDPYYRTYPTVHYSSDGKNWEVASNKGIIEGPYGAENFNSIYDIFVSYFNDIAYNNGVYVATSGNELWRIADGLSSGYWHKCGTFDNARIVATNDGFLVYSPNGMYTAISTDGAPQSWTSGPFIRTGAKDAVNVNGEIFYLYDDAISENTTGWNHVAYGNGKYVATSSKKYIATSNDGNKWNVITGNGFTQNGEDITNSVTEFVSDKVISELDTLSFNNAFGGTSIAYGDGKYVAVNGNKVAYSYDGKVWKILFEDTAYYPSEFVGVAYGNGKFVAVSKNSSTYIRIDSSDMSVKKSYLDNYNGNNGWWGLSISYAGQYFVAQCSGQGGSEGVPQGTYTLKSADGISWTPTKDLESIAYYNGVYVGTSTYNSSTYIYRSTNFDWTEVTRTYAGGKVKAIDNGFIVYSPTNTRTASSEDGLTWTFYENVQTGLVDVIPANGKVIYLYDTTGGSDASGWKSGVYGNGKVLIVSSNGYSATSVDGITWKTHSNTGFIQNGTDVTKSVVDYILSNNTITALEARIAELEAKLATIAELEAKLSMMTTEPWTFTTEEGEVVNKGVVINNLPTFSAYGEGVEETYMFEEGMTWTDFVDSDYNRDTNFYINADGYVMYNNEWDHPWYVSTSTTYQTDVLGTDVIIKDTTYGIHLFI
jgi:hypothetical protein